jgi:hypothetical protein
VFKNYLFRLTVPVLNWGVNLTYYNIVPYRPITRQRLGKHFPAGANALKNRTSIPRQRINKHVFSTTEWLCFLRGPCRGDIKGQRKSFELDVKKLVEFWRWQPGVIKKKWQEKN